MITQHDGIVVVHMGSRFSTGTKVIPVGDKPSVAGTVLERADNWSSHKTFFSKAQPPQSLGPRSVKGLEVPRCAHPGTHLCRLSRTEAGLKPRGGSSSAFSTLCGTWWTVNKSPSAASLTS